VTFEYPEGVLGPSESESMSTPSATACFAKQQLKSIPTQKKMIFLKKTIILID
jgi:hypothetical protein